MKKPQESQLKRSGRWRALILLGITLLFSMSTWFSASAVIPQLQEAWGLNPKVTAWLTIAVQVGFVTGAVVSSLLNLADVYSPQNLILIGSVGAAAVNLLINFAGGLTMGILLRFATGFFLAGVYPPAFKLMSTWFRKDRGLALGILAGAIVVGNGMPHLVNGLGGLDWRLVIYATSGLTLIGGLVTKLWISDGPYPFPLATFDPRQAGRVLKNRGVRLAAFGYLGHMWELFAMFAWFSAFFADMLVAHGIKVGSAAAFATFAVFFSGGIGCWLGGILADHWGRTRTTSLMMVISGTCALLIGLFFRANPWLVLAIGLVWGFAVVADSAQFSTMVTELADRSYVGTALTLQLALGFTVTVATIWLIPFLQNTLGWMWAFAFLAPGPVFGVIAMMRLRSLPEAVKMNQGRR